MVLLKSLLGLAALTTHVLASPTVPSVRRDVASGLIILEEYPMEDGFITIYGDDPDATPSAEDASALQRRCGSNTLLCATTYQALSMACDVLISDLQGMGNLPVSPRSVCRTITLPFPYGDHRCCASWANNVSGLKGSYLYNAALKTRNGCITGSAVSGKSRDTNLGGVCTTQCLSNRPDGCSY